MEARILSEGGQSWWFGIERGLRQGSFVDNIVQPACVRNGEGIERSWDGSEDR